MRRNELIRLNKELDQMAIEDEISTYDSLSPHEKTLMEANKQLDQITPHKIISDEEFYPMPSEKSKTRKTKKGKKPKLLFASARKTSPRKDSQRELMMLENQELTKQAEAAKGNTNFAAGLFFTSLVSFFIPGFFGMSLVLMGVTYYMYYKAKKKQTKIERTLEEIRVRLATLTSQNNAT